MREAAAQTEDVEFADTSADAKYAKELADKLGRHVSYGILVIAY